MFTGLVEGKGIIASAAAEGPARRVVVAPPALLDDGTCRLGDSVAVNGCCLTVVAIDGRGWAFQAGEETLSKTTLGGLAAVRG